MRFQKLLYFLQNVGRDPSSLIIEDYLTGLKNRRYFHQYLKSEIAWDSLEKHPVSLLMVDIDYFKRINEQYGHIVGDEVLIYITEILKKISGKKGIPILYAGDKFMLVMPGIKKHNALIAGDDLVRHVNENIFFSSDAGTEIPITLSIGIATAPEDAGDGDGLIRQVNNALFHAKQLGRNRYADAGEVSRQALQYLDSAGIVGRKSQLEQVWKALKKVSDGISRFVIVDGAPGMGKTSFLDTVQRNLGKKKLNPIRIAGAVQESFRPYYLVSYIVMELMNQREDKGIDVLEKMDEKDIVNLSYIIPQLSVDDVPSPENSDQQREEIFKSFLRFLILLVDNRPLILLIDDLDYSDPASLHLIRTIIKEKSVLLFICGTASKEKQTAPKAIPLDLFRSAYSENLGIQDIHLDPLTVEDIEKHINIIFPQINMPQRLIRELVQTARGNPLFIMEILRRMIGEQKIVQSGQKWEILSLEKGYFPKSLEEIVRKKMTSLDDESKIFLDRASVFGESISLSMLTGISDEKSAKIHDFLDQVIAQGIVRSDFTGNDESIRFINKRIQEIVYEGIQPAQKKNIHEQIGNYQEKLYNHNLLPSASLLAYHFKRSDNQEKAKTYEQFEEDRNQRIFNNQEASKYGETDVDDAGINGLDEIGDVPLSSESLLYIPKLFQSILIAIRNTRLYPSGSKSVINAVRQLQQFIEKTFKDTSRVSIIVEKKSILINGQELEVGNFQAIARKIIDFWDRIELKSLTFIKGLTEEELEIFMQKLSHIEQKELISTFWKTFAKEKKLIHIRPRQIKYAKIEDETEGALPEPLADVSEPATYEHHSVESESYQGLDDADIKPIKRVIAALLSTYSKFKLYPAHGPVAKKAIEKAMAVLADYFKRQSALSIARVEASFLVNGVKMNPAGFEKMADGLVQFLKDTKLNSITFINIISETDLLEFFSASSQPPAEDTGITFWQELAEAKQISGILFNQRIYGVLDEGQGDSGEEDKTETDDEMEKIKESSLKDLDMETVPDLLRKLYLSGDKKKALAVIKRFCQEYQALDEAGRKSLLDIFETILKPEAWRPGPGYIKFVLKSTISLFDDETNSELIAKAADLFHFCSEMFILFGEYELAAWVFSLLQSMGNAAEPSGPMGGVHVFEKSMDQKIIDVIAQDLKSESHDRQQGAYQLLSSMGKGILPFLIDIIKRESNIRVRRMVAELMKSKGQEGADLLKKSIMDESRPEYRARILDVIDSVTTDCIMELTDTLSDNADVVRRSAFRLAERLNTQQTIGLLMEFAQEESPELAVPAINSLGKLNVKAAADLLILRLKGSDIKEVRVAACRAMGQIAAPSFIAPLENLLKPKRRLFFKKREEIPVKVAAVYALSQIPGQGAARVLATLSDDSDFRIQEVLKKLSSRSEKIKSAKSQT